MESLLYEDQLRLLERIEPDDILNRLALLAQQPKPALQFFNYYKEVPVSSPVEILYVFGDTLACRVSEVQSRAIQNSRYTIIRSPQLGRDLYATAEFKEETNEVILSDFAYVEVLPDRRTTLRVKIGGLFRLAVEAGPDTFEAKLRDLSLGGCALEIPDKNLLGKFAYFYLNFSFDLKNYPQPQQLRIMARFLRFEGEGPPARGIFLFEHDKRSEDLVGMYIAQRQAEIIKELKM
ncbi:PilZ domain-containing protein [Trichlorobacter ammonificans]|uniref:Type IV pilus assembly PilZ n=1 Tax=Trichlorobacter ammonificans TaxID=2916410 RepID=A0ABM9DBM7_9BACT|nr:PilZ domain-containing protein [Trichlorobacter ammonificans]CAH2032595.1 Type IV pilus assembly PilZ [Trichlorobacter ammonificans]